MFYLITSCDFWSNTLLCVIKNLNLSLGYSGQDINMNYIINNSRGVI